MKLKDAFAFLGFRQAARTYPFRIDTFDLPVAGQVRFAQWLHPKCAPRTIEQSDIDGLREYLASGDAVIDIGAHSGDTTALFALAVGPSGIVFAAEPNSYVLPTLRENARLNAQAAPVVILPYAATETDARLVFNYSDPGYCNGGDLDKFGRFSHGHLYPLEVEGRNMLTELRRDHPDWLDRIRLVKTDTEGNDHATIRSLAPLLKSVRPYLLCEIYKRTTPEQRTAFLTMLIDELGYDCFLSESFSELKGQSLSVADVGIRDHYDIFCMPR